MSELLRDNTRDHRHAGLVLPISYMQGPDVFSQVGPDIGGNFATAAQYMPLLGRDGAKFDRLALFPDVKPDDSRCPYNPDFTFSINPEQIVLDTLVQDGDLNSTALATYRDNIAKGGSYAELMKLKNNLIQEAHAGFSNDATPARRAEFTAWCNAADQRGWLEKYAAYTILKSLPENQDKPWQEWPHGRDANPDTIRTVSRQFAKQFEAFKYEQWVAEKQAKEFRITARDFGIETMGDVPFYVGSGDVWATPHIFNLDADGRPRLVSGAPPDAYAPHIIHADGTETGGQKWGHAVYNTSDDTIRPKVVDFLAERLVRASNLNGGAVRMDHCIGYVKAWLVENDAPNGVHGTHAQDIGDEVVNRYVKLYNQRFPGKTLSTENIPTLYAETFGEERKAADAFCDRHGIATLAGWGYLRDHWAQESLARQPDFPDNFPPNGNVVALLTGHDDPPAIQTLLAMRDNYWGIGHVIEDINTANRRIGCQGPITRESSNKQIIDALRYRIWGSLARTVLMTVQDVRGSEVPMNIPGTINDHPDSSVRRNDGHENWTGTFDISELRVLIGSLRTLNETTRRGLAA